MSGCLVSERLDITSQCGDYPECDTCDCSPRAIPINTIPEKILYWGVGDKGIVEVDITHVLREGK